MTFKEGDRVVVTSRDRFLGFCATVGPATIYHTSDGTWLDVIWDKVDRAPCDGGWASHRFELIKEQPAVTDAELAAQLRDSYKKYQEASNELKSRGWNVLYTNFGEYKITKTEVHTL